MKDFLRRYRKHLIWLLVLSAPLWLWLLRPKRELEVVFLDKTVPDQKRREHVGPFWILNYLKYVRRFDRKTYDAETDFYGFHPEDGQRFEIEPLPPVLKISQLIYLTDTYGVFEGDFYPPKETSSPWNLIYGGLRKDEMNIIEPALVNHKTLIAEFNTLGSPTGAEARKQLSETLHLKWKGWFGRRFADLSEKVGEVPKWARERYEKEYNERWKWEGDGIVLVGEYGGIVVLGAEEDLKLPHLKFSINEKGAAHFGFQRESRFYYWFDIVAPEPGAEVFANYHLDLNESGKKKMKKFGLPTDFPAIIYYKNENYRCYYFAGDFADLDSLPEPYWLLGLPQLNRAVHFFQTESQTPFFWNIYYPVMKKILDTCPPP